MALPKFTLIAFCSFSFLFLIPFSTAGEDERKGNPVKRSVGDVDYYCQFEDCWDQHIACNNDGSFDPSCPNGVQEIDLTALQDLILNVHNSLRDNIAAGLPPLKPAVRMVEMQWDSELATLAMLNAKTCVMEHDICRETERFTYSGQSISRYNYTDDKDHATDVWLTEFLIRDWFSEYVGTTTDMIDSYPENEPLNPIGHFTIIVTDRNTHVGCAAVRFKVADTNTFQMTCNYGSNNVYGAPVYITGTEPASKCEKGKSSNYSHLCKVGEEYELP